MSFTLRIGLEVHVELATDQKLFCTCLTAFGQKPNSQVCPVCLGEPDQPPRLNQAVLDLAVLTCLALECEISRPTSFDRKHYQAQDMPKGYQLTQFHQPIGRRGKLRIFDNQTIRIRQLHLEEDSGRTISAADGKTRIIDFNRSGIPLLEIVTEPDLTCADEAVEFLWQLRRLLLYLAVSDCRMEEGSMRVDVNVSVAEADGPASPVELKNLNSFRAVRRAIMAESERQKKILLTGGQVSSQTRRWDEKAGRSCLLREKKGGTAYRYCPEPDLLPIVLDDTFIDRIRSGLVELPWHKEKSFQDLFGLSAQQARLLTAQPQLADFFARSAHLSQAPLETAHWLLGNVAAICRDLGLDLAASRLRPAGLARLIQLLAKKKISRSNAEQILLAMIEDGVDPDQYVAKQDLALLAGTSELKELVKQVLAQEPAAVQAYLAGKEKVKTFLLGQLMKKSRGQADPDKARQILTAELAARITYKEEEN